MAATFVKPEGKNASHVGTSYAKLIINTSVGTALASYQEIFGLQDIPQVGGNRNTIDVTCLADEAERSILGIKRGATSLTFKLLHDADNFAGLLALDNAVVHQCQVQFPDGAGGAIDTVCQFNAYISISQDGASVDGALTDTLTLIVAAPDSGKEIFDYTATAWTPEA